ncbi:MAG: hypothetical protein ACLTMP_10925 [Eggerthella lenta]
MHGANLPDAAPITAGGAAGVVGRRGRRGHRRCGRRRYRGHGVSPSRGSRSSASRRGPGGRREPPCRTFANVFGGSKDQNALEFSVPTFPPDVKAFTRMYEEQNAYSIDEKFLMNQLLMSVPRATGSWSKTA